MQEEKLEKETLGQRIKRLRKERGISQVDLARSCGVTDPWISQVEQDKVTASASLLNKIAETFKVSIRELLQDEEEHLEMVSRIKLVEVLLEKNHPEEAFALILGLQNRQELSEDEKIKLSVYLSESMYQQKKYDAALEILTPLILKLETENYYDVHTLAWIRNCIGKTFYRKSEFINAYYNYQKAYDLTSRFIEFDSLAARISYNVGMTLRRRGAHKRALPYLEKASQYFQNKNSQWELANSLLEQGLAYKNIKDYKTACDCFDQAKAIFQILNLKKWEHDVQITIASSITIKDDPLKAIEQLQYSLEAMLDEKDFAGAVFVYAKKAEIFLNLNQKETCTTSLNDGFKLVESYSLYNTLESGELHMIAARYANHNNHFSEAVDYALKSSEIFGRINLIRDQVNALKIAVDSYESTRNFEEALRLERKRNDLLQQLSEERSSL